MNIYEMTKEQLMAHVEALSTTVEELSAVKADYEKVKAALDASERFHYLFDNAPIGLVITNMQGIILDATKAIREALGYSEQELINMDVRNLYVNADDRSCVLSTLKESGFIRDFETQMIKRGGAVATVLLNSDIIELDNEKVLLTSIYDFTQYKQIQDELSKTEDRYELLFNNVPVGITVTDFYGNIIACNQAIQELMGYTAEEIKGQNARSFYVNTAERQRILEVSEIAGKVRDYETQFLHKNGNVITVLINTDVITYKGNQQILINSIRDITPIKKIEETLTKERDFTNTILDTTATLVMVLNNKGQITRFNQACESNTGYTFEEIKDRYIWDALSEDAASAKARFSELMAGNYPIKHESGWRTKNGTRRLISWSSTLLDNESKEKYVVATGIDITERKLAEIELFEANQKLNNWVIELEERTRQMKQLSDMGEQLQSCQTMKEVCAIGAQYIRVLFPQSRGAIYLIRPSRDLAEAVEMWGDPSYTNEVFLPSECWSIRRNRPHMIDKMHPGLLCSHITGPKDADYLCMPMMANGEFIGVLHLNSIASEQECQGLTHLQSGEQVTQFVMEMAEHIAMALSNLKLREALRQQSIRDSLTGLFNRRYMEETLDRELRRAEREKNSVGVIMFDIDHFKEFNDLSGHDGGDALLRELGAYLVKSTRGGDIVCRYGGEEFVAVLPGASMEETRKRAEEMRQGVKELLVYHLGKPLGRCTMSLGVAAYPDHGQNSEMILKSADSALYRAKNEGRDRVIVFGDDKG